MNRNGSAVMQRERKQAPATGTVKVAILAGGAPTRLGTDAEVRPKAMVEVGDKPLLWHVMKHYTQHGFGEFVIATGVMSGHIERFLRAGCDGDAWSAALIYTGCDAATGGRVKQLQPFLGEGTFMLAWGDALSDVNPHDLLTFHRRHGRLATVMAVRPSARFGRLDMVGDQIVDFAEKPKFAEGWVSGGLFVLEPSVFDYIDGDAMRWDGEPLERLARDSQLVAYKHHGFWLAADSLRDLKQLESLWATGKAPWQAWGTAPNKKTTAA